jgi:hypothetical protein
MRAENFPAASKILKQIDATLSGLVSQVITDCYISAVLSVVVFCSAISDYTACYDFC